METTLTAITQNKKKITCAVTISDKGELNSQYPIKYAENKKMNLAGYSIVLSKKQAEKIFKRKCPVAEVNIMLENSSLYSDLCVKAGQIERDYLNKKNIAEWTEIVKENRTFNLKKIFYSSGNIGLLGLPDCLGDKKDFLKHAIEFDNNDERYTAKISATEINAILAKSAKNKREKENAEQVKIDALRKVAEETGEAQILSTCAVPAGYDLLESDTLITYVNPDGTVTKQTYRDW